MFSGDKLQQPAGTLSGGEKTRLSLATLVSSRANVLLLDEPTNNLDAAGKSKVTELISSSPTPILVISHDLDLLSHVEYIAELYAGNLRIFSGNYHSYRQAIEAEQRVAEAETREAKAEHRKQVRERAAMQVRISRDQRRGTAFSHNHRKPGLAMGNDKNRSQNTAAKRSAQASDSVKTAFDAYQAAQNKIRPDEHVHLDLPGTQLPNGTRVLTSSIVDLTGPEHVRLMGPNGSGKTTFLNAISRGDVEYSLDCGYLRQKITLPEDRTILEMVTEANPSASPQSIRDQLAQLLFREDQVHRRAGLLSGGERFRAEFARVLLAEPSPQFLLLDEPTNDLDIDTLQELESLLDSWPGTMVVISHDRYLIERIADNTYALFGDGKLTNLPGGIDEYLRKRAALEAQHNSGVLNLGEKKPDSSAPKPEKKLSSQQEREITKKMNALERKMHKLEKAAAQINEKMATAAEKVDTQALTELDGELKDNRSAYEELEMEWLELGEKLEG